MISRINGFLMKLSALGQWSILVLLIIVSGVLDAAATFYSYSLAQASASGTTRGFGVEMRENVLPGWSYYQLSILTFWLSLYLGYFLRLPLAVINTLWSVGVIITVTFVGRFFFGETLTVTKLIGVGLGMVAIYLMVK